MSDFNWNPDPSFVDKLTNLDSVYLLNGRDWYGYPDPLDLLVCKVERLTNTLVILANGRRFRRKDGLEVASNYEYPAKILPMDTSSIQTRAAAHDRYELCQRVKKIPVSSLTTDQLQRIVNILNENND